MKVRKLLAALLAANLLLLGLYNADAPRALGAETEMNNLALDKKVYYSSEEGVSSQGKDTRAVNAVDGRRDTWWTAQTKNVNGDWDAQYPEWLCVDLGKVYNISRIELELEAKGGGRVYDYNIYASVDQAPIQGSRTIPAGFSKILEVANNTVSGVQPAATFSGIAARYVLVEIVKCNQYSEAAKWTAASIYELEVYGTDVKSAEDAKEDAKVTEKKTDNLTKIIPIQTASGRDENYVVELDGEWLFGGKGLKEEEALTADRSAWEKVTIPHTWNAKDGEDGGNNYVRGAFWYHKEFTLDNNWNGRNIYIEFLGSNTKTDVYVNGKQVGPTHKGGYTAFRYNITDFVKKGKNVLDVRVDNSYDITIAPISGDFNMYGGIYRRVYLIGVNDVHIDLENYGSSGLFLTTGNMRSKTAPKDLGKFNIKADIVNETNTKKTVTVVATVTGDNAPEPIVKTLTVPANGKVTFSEDCKVENPTLWEGIDYSKGADNSKTGYMYTVTLEIKDGDSVIDKVKDKIGFRYFWIDSSDNGESGEGFFLNGKKYPLRGVNRHSYLAGVGSAMTEEQHARDIEIIKELGANTIRLCHYPQTDYFYDLCDENGIIVWTEIPLVNEIRATEDFYNTTKTQLIELIRQQYNRPSVIFWGLHNEVGQGTSLTNAKSNNHIAKMKEFIYELDALAKAEDKTGRYTTQAVNRDYAMDQNEPNSVNKNFDTNVGWKSDLIAWNIYPGWYPDANFYGTFEEVMIRKSSQDSRPMALSEYGWGANVSQHEAYPELNKNGLTAGGAWHPEEYQNIMNEEALDYINRHDELWATYYWVMFDFAVDARNEGSQPALNDKGLVTANRQIKKDSFYLYKANWNKNETFAYITSRRWVDREAGKTYIKVYSNCDNVELFVNNQSLGKMTYKGNGVFIMENVVLEVGKAEIKAVGTCNGDTERYVDSCIWNVNVPKNNDAAYENIALNKPVYCSSEEGTGTDGASTVAEMAVDGNQSSRWTAYIKNGPNGAENALYPEWLCVDLGAVYEISKIDLILESKGNRTYDYKIYTSIDTVPEEKRGPVPKGFTEVYSRIGNTEVGKQSTITLSGRKARYVLVEILSCSLYSDSTKYVAASIYELSVAGKKVDVNQTQALLADRTASPKTGESKMAWYLGLATAVLGLAAFLTGKRIIKN